MTDCYTRFRILRCWNSYSAALCAIVLSVGTLPYSPTNAVTAASSRSSLNVAQSRLFSSKRLRRQSRWVSFETKNQLLSHEEIPLSSVKLPPRGGSTDWVSDDEEEDSETDEEEKDDQATNMEEDQESEKDSESSSSLSTAPPFSSEPITVAIKTNMGPSLIDHRMELLVTPSRTIASVKQTLSRQLPGRPPVSLLRLVHDSQVLSDEEVMETLVDEDDEEDDEESTSARGLVLILDIVPPVDPKFAVDVVQKMEKLSTMELLEAYAANAAAMTANGLSLVDGSPAGENDDDMSRSLTSVTLRQTALQIRQQLESQYTEGQLEQWRDPPTPAGGTPLQIERRGQRVRSGSRGGARTSMRMSLQRNLNINWADTVRNFLLFLFFGLFGGRSVVSRNLLLLGAPMCFVLQARPVKIMLKQMFYACHDPPSILLSLLPAPEQAILSFHYDDSWKALYGTPLGKGGKHIAEELSSSGDEEDSNELDDDNDDSWDTDVDSESDVDSDYEE